MAGQYVCRHCNAVQALQGSGRCGSCGAAKCSTCGLCGRDEVHLATASDAANSAPLSSSAPPHTRTPPQQLQAAQTERTVAARRSSALREQQQRAEEIRLRTARTLRIEAERLHLELAELEEAGEREYMPALRSHAWTDVPWSVGSIPDHIESTLRRLSECHGAREKCDRCADAWARFNRLPGLNFFLHRNAGAEPRATLCGKCYVQSCTGGCG